MKKLLFIIVCLLVLPVMVNAKDEKIKVYVFKGEGCGYCASAIEFLNGIEDEYGKYFELETYDVWYDEDNAELMQNVAAYFEEDVAGVPYIIIGDKSFQGYAVSYNEEIKKQIKSEYDNPNYEDIVKKIKEDGATIKRKKDDTKTDQYDIKAPESPEPSKAQQSIIKLFINIVLRLVLSILA